MLTALTPDLHMMFFGNFIEIYMSFFCAASVSEVPVGVPANMLPRTCPADDFSHEEPMQLPIILMPKNEKAESPP